MSKWRLAPPVRAGELPVLHTPQQHHTLPIGTTHLTVGHLWVCPYFYLEGRAARGVRTVMMQPLRGRQALALVVRLTY